MIERSQNAQPPQPGFSNPQHLNATRSTDPSPSIPSTGFSQAIRILVVEDMAQLAELYREVLMLHGFEVTIAQDGTTALKLLTERTFHAAMVDIDLPDISGFDVVERARAAGRLSQTRVVFCTGGYVEERMAKSRQFPNSGFMSKPFSIKQLLTTVSDALGGSEI